MSYESEFSPEAISIVRETWIGIKEGIGEDADLIVSMLVFKTFFEDYPSAIEYFKHYGCDAQAILNNIRFKIHGRKNVFKSLDKVIDVLDNLEEIEQIAEWIRVIHKNKRIHKKDYENLGNSIVKSVKGALGEKGTEEVIQAWTSIIGKLMLSFAA